MAKNRHRRVSVAPEKSDVDAATELGAALDAAMARYVKAKSPTNERELVRALSVVFLSGMQYGVSKLLTVDGKPGAVQQLDRAIAMVATAMGFTKDTPKPESPLILPGG